MRLSQPQNLVECSWVNTHIMWFKSTDISDCFSHHWDSQHTQIMYHYYPGACGGTWVSGVILEYEDCFAWSWFPLNAFLVCFSKLAACCYTQHDMKSLSVLKLLRCSHDSTPSLIRWSMLHVALGCWIQLLSFYETMCRSLNCSAYWLSEPYAAGLSRFRL